MRIRLTDEDYTPLNGEKLPSKLIPKLLLKLYELFSDYYDPQRGKVLRRTLAACRLVCRQWSKIVAPKRSWFIIRVDGKEWASCSWYRVRRPPLQLQDGRRRDQESDTGPFTQSYSENLMKSHPKFLPELTQNILPGFYKREDNYHGYFRWKDEEKSVIQSTLAACCLVSREWNRIFTPVLYEEIFLGVKNPLLTRSLLHRTFRQTHPAHKALVKTMTIAPAVDGSTANLLSICFSLPNLRKLILDFKRFDLSTLNPNFVQQLRSLSTLCTIQIQEDGHNVEIGGWESLPCYVDFMRRTKSASLGFHASSSDVSR